MTSFLVFCFGSEHFISVYADSFCVKESPDSGCVNVWFETSENYVACFPLPLVFKIVLFDDKGNHKLVFENTHKLNRYDYKIFD